MPKFWNFVKNEAKPDEVELRISGEIVDDEDVWIYEWFGIPAASPNKFREELSEYAGKNVIAWIDSFGGSVFAATGICNALLSHKKTGATITTIGDGKVMSAAVAVFLSGDKRKSTPGCLYMVHNPLTYASGYATTLRKAAEMLDIVKESILNIYQSATGLSREKISAMMDSETYMDATTAVKNNIATEVIDFSGIETGGKQGKVANFAFNRIDVQNSANSSMQKLCDIAKKIGESSEHEIPPKSVFEKIIGAVLPTKNSKIKEEKEMPDIKTFDDLKAHNSELAGQIVNDAVQGERSRIVALDAIDDLQNPTIHALVVNAKASGVTADELKPTIDIVKNTSNSADPKGKEWLNGVAVDTKESGVDNVSAEGISPTSPQDTAVLNALGTSILNKSQKEGAK